MFFHKEITSLSNAIVTLFKLEATDTPGMATAIVMHVTQGSRNKAVALEDLEMRVRKAGQLAQQTRAKAIVIEASIHEIEIFHPTIRIIRPPPPPEPASDDGFSLFAEVLLKAA